MSRNRLIFVLAASSVAVGIAACGGVASDLVGGGSSDGGDENDGSSFGHPDSGHDGSVSGNDSGPRADGGKNGSDGGGGDGGKVEDSGPPHHVVQCGTNGTTTGTGTVVDCTAASPVCCVSQYPFDTTPQSFSCTATDPSCVALDAGSIPMGCRDNADCPPSTQCCGHVVLDDFNPLNPIYLYDSVRCAASCPLSLPDGGGSDFRLFCDPSESPSVCTRPGASCGASTLLPGFNVCGTP